MTEKDIKVNEPETKQPHSHVKEIRRYTRENKKVSTKQNESQTGPHAPRGKNKDANSNFTQTEDKTALL